ncbi:hypothetical protein DH86_00001385 [Scytalidium sp. 3C]|nr:hypothetical protein DH86_00001385 [Scytalidium sp. 3C]
MGLLAAKWAKYGVTSTHDKAILGIFVLAQTYIGFRYFKLGVYEAAAAVWATPALCGLGHLLK